MRSGLIALANVARHTGPGRARCASRCSSPPLLLRHKIEELMHGVGDRLRVIAPLTGEVASPDEGLDFAVAHLDRHAAEVAPAPGSRTCHTDCCTGHRFLRQHRYI